MKFNLIVCTYKRKASLEKLLQSVKKQSLYPDEIIIIDGSPDKETKKHFQNNKYNKLQCFHVDEKNRGLTRQRNFGVSQTAEDIEICCFLDDDIILEPDYFENLIKTYILFPDAIGVGGYILDEAEWFLGEAGANDYSIGGYHRKLGRRNVVRKKLRLLSDQPPEIMPEFSNGLSISFLPSDNTVYFVEFFMGGVASYKKELLGKVFFSSYFEGYGLYEDLDFCLRASALGKLYVNTAARVYHFHEQVGRPDPYKYGKMVIRNGWYVWRIKYPHPSLKAVIKWNATSFLLTLIRLSNAISDKNAFYEALGRFSGWWSLLI